MEEKNNKRNGVDRVPSRATWPPPWLTPTPDPLACVDRKPVALDPPAERPEALDRASGQEITSAWDLPPGLYERWEERVCIMHFDGKLPWPEAERLALADVPSRATAGAVQKPDAAVQADLFTPKGDGPYGNHARR